MNSPTWEMALRVRDHLEDGNDVDSVEMISGFYQDWLLNPPEIRQTWRLDSKWCGLGDIATHAADGASVIAGSAISKVMTSTHSKARLEKREKPALDNGEMEIEFENGLKATVKYHQALEGHSDDIHWMVRLNKKEGTQISLMWRMEWGCDSLWIAKVRDADPDKQKFWKRHLRKGSSEFSEAANSAFSVNPPGHIQGWSDLWKIFFLRGFRAILSHSGDTQLAEQMVTAAMGYCPDFRKSGGNTMAFFDAAVRCHETGQPCDVPVAS